MNKNAKPVREGNAHPTTGQTTITVEAPSLDAAWNLAGAQLAAAAQQKHTGDEYSNFYALTKALVGVPKHEIDGERRAEQAAKDPRIQAALAASAVRHESGTQGEPDDPQGLTDRIERLKRS